MKKVFVILDPSDTIAEWTQLVNVAKQLGETDLMVVGDSGVLEAAAQLKDIHTLFWSEEAALSNIPEHLEETIASMLEGYSMVLMSTSWLGGNLVPRLMGRCNGLVVTGVTEVVSGNEVKRRVRSGEVIETLSLPSVSLIGMTIDLAGYQGTIDESISEVAAVIKKIESKRALYPLTIQPVVSEVSDQVTLDEADIVLGCGIGVSDIEEVDSLVQAFNKMALTAKGATRNLVDQKRASADVLIGQTGKSIAPEVYIALGLSGASQHVCGIRQAKTIIGVNKDPQAPIFQVSDYGLIGDLKTLLPEWIDSLNKSG